MAFTLRRSFALAATLLAGCQRLEISDDGSDPFFTTSSSSSGSSGVVADSGEESEESNDTTQPAFDCDPVLQTGCSGGGEKCTAVISSGALEYVCAADPGNLDPFESCQAALGTGVDGCPAGYVCVSDEYDAGLCVPLCLDNNDCTDAVCLPEPQHHIPFCAGECSPFEGGCVQPQQCRRGDDRFACTFPLGDDNGADGEACTPQGDAGCAEGYVCITGQLVPDCSADNCCTSVCDVNDDTCTSPSTCVPIFPAPAPGFESIGACLVPA